MLIIFFCQQITRIKQSGYPVRKVICVICVITLIILSPAYHGDLRVFFLINRFHGLYCFLLVILAIRGDPTPRKVISLICVITLIIFLSTNHTATNKNYSPYKKNDSPCGKNYSPWKLNGERLRLNVERLRLNVERLRLNGERLRLNVE